MNNGFHGKILKINLSDRTREEISIAGEKYKKYLSGSGLAGWILTSNYDPELPPLDEKSPLIFMAGMLTGTRVPTACKVSVVGKSPLTGIWAESTVGGFFGSKLKRTGYDGVVLTGKASGPVYLQINEGEVDFQTADNLWGKDVYASEKSIKEESGEDYEVACIGPAGENQALIAGIMIGGRETRAAGRCGMGALMGSKNVKAVAVNGEKKPSLYDKEGLNDHLKQFIPELRDKAEGLTKYGTAGGVMAVEANGDLPIKNWQLGSWEEGAEKTSGQHIDKTVLTGHYSCYACPIRCGKDVEIRVGPFKGEEGHGPEYETCAAFGSMVLNDDIDYLCAANDLCNRYGLDTISTGNAVAMAIECYEKGIISGEDTDGLQLEWGNGEAILNLIEKIASREGIGDILSLGVKRAAEELGGNAEEFAVHTKGLSYAFHDPRAFTSMAGNYATANRGACHLEALSYFTESGTYPAENFGFDKEIEPHHHENKGELAAVMQNFMNLFNALGLCKFLIRGEVTTEDLSEWVNLVTGWNFDVDELIEIGERLHNLKRMYNVQQGISRKDDNLPPRLLTHDRETGRAGGSLPHLGRILSDYYEYRGWSKEGIPESDKLDDLGLEYLNQ